MTYRSPSMLISVRAISALSAAIWTPADVLTTCTFVETVSLLPSAI